MDTVLLSKIIAIGFIGLYFCLSITAPILLIWGYFRWAILVYSVLTIMALIFYQLGLESFATVALRWSIFTVLASSFYLLLGDK